MITETNWNSVFLLAVLHTTFNRRSLKSLFFLCAYDSDTPNCRWNVKVSDSNFVQHWTCRFEMFPPLRILLLWTALSTWRIFYKNFGDIIHLFQIAYFTKVLQINSLSSKENISRSRSLSLSHTHTHTHTQRDRDHLPRTTQHDCATYSRLGAYKITNNATGSSSRKTGRISALSEALLEGCCVLNGKVVPVCTMETHQESSGKATFTPHLCTRSRWMVTLTPGESFPGR
jgi:hypothetical protein